jgi:4'-phosphopantetheinyl transferase EntD
VSGGWSSVTLAPEALSKLVSAEVGLGSCTSREPSRGGEQIAELAELHASAGTRRRDDFIRGRIAARGALRGLGIDARSIPIGPWRQPVWPPGVIGSISHSAGAGIAVAARAVDMRGIGVDVEARDRRLSLGATRRLLCRTERWALEGGTTMPWPLVLFCAKEAAYKAVFQAYGRRLVPSDLAFERPATEKSASLDCEIERPRRRLRARYALSGRFLVACVEFVRESPAEERENAV